MRSGERTEMTPVRSLADRHPGFLNSEPTLAHPTAPHLVNAPP